MGLAHKARIAVAVADRNQRAAGRCYSNVENTRAALTEHASRAIGSDRPARRIAAARRLQVIRATLRCQPLIALLALLLGSKATPAIFGDLRGQQFYCEPDAITWRTMSGLAAMGHLVVSGVNDNSGTSSG